MKTPHDAHQVALSERRAAEALDFHPSTLRRRRLAGDGPRFCRLGGSIRYLLTDLREWAESQREEA